MCTKLQCGNGNDTLDVFGNLLSRKKLLKAGVCTTEEVKGQIHILFYIELN